MPETHFKVKVESDHIRKLTAAKPIPALAELIWNACDADATRIDVDIDRNEFGMNAITVRDNGHGIPCESIVGTPVPALFSPPFRACKYRKCQFRSCPAWLKTYLDKQDLAQI
jgi:DNA topoisomerase VI subunit B